MPQNPLSKEQIRAELAQHEQNQALYARLIEKRKEHLDYAKGIVKRMRSHNQAPFFFYHEVEFGLQRETIDSAIPFGTPLEEAVRRANAEWNRLPASQKNITFNEIKKT